MFKHILLSLNGYKISYLRNDVISGVGVAALTIPVAMGYAQVAGLPPIYGLYASFLPVIAYVILPVHHNLFSELMQRQVPSQDPSF